MSRLRADLLLLITAIIWGTAFIAQKTGMEALGPLVFVGARFGLSFLFVLPFIRMEKKHGPIGRGEYLPIFSLCLVFVAAVFLQHFGVVYTSVTNAGFLTGLYVIFVPLMAWVMIRRPPTKLVSLACALAIIGVWFLNGASLAAFTIGDWLVIACAVGFALHLVITGILVQRTRRPVTLAAIQYGFCAVLALALGAVIEGIDPAALQASLWQIFYAGIISGGIAYTLQAVAQQYTPSSDAAIILSAEALFAALAGAWIMGDRLEWIGWVGCALILGSILLIELGPSFLKRKALKHPHV